MTGRTLIAAATAAFAAFAAPGSKAEEVPLRGIVEGYYGRPWGTGINPGRRNKISNYA